MARNINDRLTKLNSRRKGTDRLDRVATESYAEVLAKSLVTESWEKRATTQPHTRYALGAMQAVGDRYTQISIDTAERVGKQLIANLPMSVSFRLQGSVPLDVHIRGVSDVDLLTLDNRFLTYNRFGSRANTYSSTTLTSLGALLELRREAERILKAAYPAAKVDCSGGKCIALSGGSLARPVDVVPSHWDDNAAYQSSLQEHDRGVTILNKAVPETLGNLPFLHIKRVHDRDTLALGGLKKAIRLTKSVKNDAENESSAAKLPSFDIAALLYHADQTALRSGYTYELAILRETQRFLDWCYHNKEAAKQLKTPDESRCILNTEDKFTALTTISVEMDALAKEVAREQLAGVSFGEPNWTQIDEALRKAYIPAAA
ncbi:hypothetical protein [Sphingomonas hankookensis]